jgi:hypothetical protein
VFFGDDPGFKRKSRGEGLKNDELLRLPHDPLFKMELFLNRIAIDTSSVVVIISGGLLQFLSDIGWNDRCPDELGMGVVQ